MEYVFRNPKTDWTLVVMDDPDWREKEDLPVILFARTTNLPVPLDSNCWRTVDGVYEVLEYIVEVLEIEDFDFEEAMESYRRWGEPDFPDSDEYAITPVYAYSHGGWTFSTDNTRSPFNDMWDAGLVGFLYADRLRWELWKMGEWDQEKAHEYLENLVEYWDMLAREGVWGLKVVDQNGKTVDSIWGLEGYESVRNYAHEFFRQYDLPITGWECDGYFISIEMEEEERNAA